MSKVFDAAQEAEFERHSAQSGTAEPIDVVASAKAMLSVWEQWFNAESKDTHTETQAANLLKAACFAAVAYEDMVASPMTADAAPAQLMRIFLTAVIDPNSTDLDQYRAINRQEPDVAAVKEAEAVVGKYGEEFTAATLIGYLAKYLRENGKAVLTASDTSLGKQILEFKLAADNIRGRAVEFGQINTQGKWLWWGGNDEEFYTYGGHAFKEDVIKEALHDKSGEFQDENGVWKIGLHICEARQDPLRFADWLDIDKIIERAEERLADSDRVNAEYDDGAQFDLNEAQKKDLEARIHEACDVWQISHGLIFNTNTFTKSRNYEYLVLDYPDDGSAPTSETVQ